MCQQALCFLAGANSLFYGERLLTAANPKPEHDIQLFKRLGICGEAVGGVVEAMDGNDDGMEMEMENVEVGQQEKKQKEANL
jgi:biotin synthase